MVMDRVRIRKMTETGSLDAITNLEDNVRKNDSVDRLPPYIESELSLSTCGNCERRIREDGMHNKKSTPSMPILQGHDQPGPEQRACAYGCGQKRDHMRGDPKCPAGPNAVWDGAPEVFKERVRKHNRGTRQEKGGKGKGKAAQRSFWHAKCES
jgi:hypothetical protein